MGSMKEVDAQKMIVDAIRAHHGFAMKLTHKFFVGIPDLLIQMREFTTSLWEVKINDAPKSPTSTVHLALTKLQQKTLKDYVDAGGIGGAISILRTPTELLMGAFEYDILMYRDAYIWPMRVARQSHFELRRGMRNEDIYNIMVGVLRNAEKRRRNRELTGQPGEHTWGLPSGSVDNTEDKEFVARGVRVERS